MTNDAVQLGIDDSVATVTLNQPDVHNALTRDIGQGIVDALDEIKGREARCVVVQGADGNFSAGGDIDVMIAEHENETSLHERVRSLVEETSETIRRLYEFHLPTVAKVEGSAFGAGANLALACDLQLASADAEFSFGFRQVGLGVDAGTSYLLPRVVGENVAKELVYTGDLVEAERAKRLGLVNRVFDPNELDDGAAEIVECVATGPTVALTNSKRLIRQGLDSTLEQALTNESAAQAAIYETRDHEEGIEAFADRRRPEFEGE